MLVRAPLVEAEQDRSVRIEDLSKVVMARVSGWPKSDWYHLQLLDTSLTPMIVQMRFMTSSLVDLKNRRNRPYFAVCSSSNSALTCRTIASRMGG